MPLSYLYLDLNSYFASVEQQLNPSLRGKPVAVVPTMTDATCAIAASYEAKAFGIKTGTMIYEAKKHCPELICVQANHEHYVAYHHKILALIDQFIPVDSILSIDEVACKLIGTECIEYNARHIALNIKQGLYDQIGAYIRCSIGIAENRFLAKTASNIEKPDGLQVLYTKQLPERIQHMQLSDLTGIGRGMLKRLHRAGIYSIESLYQLSEYEMRTIWGSIGGARYYHMLRGVELPPLPTKRRSVGHSHVLAPEMRPTDKARQVMQRLVLKAASRLRRLGLYSSKMSLSVRIEHGARVSFESDFPAVMDNMNLMQCACRLWGSIIQQHRPNRIKKVSVILHGLVEEHHLQSDLFASNNKQTNRYESLSNAMDKINARFGRDSITLGGLPHQARSFSGTKVAFTRIPDTEEFYE